MKKYTPKNGDWINCTIDRVKVKNARISITQFGIFLCHNHRTIKPTKAFNPPKFGFNFATKISQISQGKTQIWKKVKDLKEVPPYEQRKMMSAYSIGVDLNTVTARIPRPFFPSKKKTKKPKVESHNMDDKEKKEIEKRYASKESFENHTLKLQIEELNNAIEKLKKDLEAAKQNEEPKGWPQEGDEIWWVFQGEIVKNCFDANNSLMKFALERGDLFPTLEAYDKDDKKRRALVRIKDFIRKEGVEFEPDWEDVTQQKHYVYTYKGKISKDVGANVTTNIDSLTGYFRTHEDKIKVIDNCEADLKILFNII